MPTATDTVILRAACAADELGQLELDLKIESSLISNLFFRENRRFQSNLHEELESGLIFNLILH